MMNSRKHITATASSTAIIRASYVVAAGLGFAVLLMGKQAAGRHEVGVKNVMYKSPLIHEYQVKCWRDTAENNPDDHQKAQALVYLIDYYIDQHDSVEADEAIKRFRPIAEPFGEGFGNVYGKIIDFYIAQKDFASADSWITWEVKQNMCDKWGDTLYLKWVMVSYRMGDYQKSYDKCQELIFQYPDSSATEVAKRLLPKIEAKLHPHPNPT